MIVSMANRYRLAGLIWAAILAAALQFAPTAARAHAGHYHHHAAVQQHDAASHTSGDEQRPVAVLPGTQEEKSATPIKQPEFAAASTRQQADHDQVNCVGGCCGAGLGCCCASSALAGAVHELPPFEAHAELITFGVRRLGGIDPEALARPPKSLA